MGKLSCPLTLDWASARAQSTVAGPSTASAEPARHLAWKRCSANAFGRLNRRQSTMGSRLPNRRSGIQYKATEASGVQVFQGDVAQHFHEKSGDASANPSIADASAPEAHQEQASRTKRSDPAAAKLLRRLSPCGSLCHARDAIHSALEASRHEIAGIPSGVLRIEVPIPAGTSALLWLQGQERCCEDEPRLFFSPRRHATPGGAGTSRAEVSTEGVMAVAGVGAAWHWRGDASRPMGPAEHAAISRLLDPGAPLLRAYGGMRFSAARSPAPEWRPFGTHLFAIPRLELVEGSTACLLCCNVVWDDAPAAPLKGSAEGAWGAPGCSVSAEEALSAALLALRGLQSPQTPRRGELRAGAKAFKHTPDRHTWASLMGPLHGSLLPAGCEEGQQPADGEGTPKGQEGEEGLTKVVLARRTDLELEGDVDPLQVLGALQERDSRAYQIFMQIPGQAVFLGAPPERLYVRTGRAVASEAVAGTRPRGPKGDEGADLRLASELLASPKEHAEFTVVREWVHEALGKVCDGVQVELPKSLLRQQSIQHLYGRLSGTMKPGMTDADLIRALHPTPAVCGQPQDKALALLDASELFDRGWYAGPFGWISGVGAEFVVAIRSALFHRGASADDLQSPGAGASGADGDAGRKEAPQKGADTRGDSVLRVASLYAGVGIVRGADIAAEWRELELKTQALRALLSPQPAITTEPTLGSLWARLLVEELCRFGISTFCVAPGSRSSPLAIAASAHPRARVVTCIDERSLGFFAVGYGRGRGQPAAVITSSGTAVANLLPSVVEASQSRVPMVVITADRPADMRDTGANQTIDQVKIFGGYTRFFTDILPPTPDVPARSILTTTSLAVRHATGHNPGPVHLNLQFREPLAPVQSALDERWLPALLEGTERWVASTRPFTVPVLASGSTQGGAAGAPPGRSRQLDEVVRDILGARRGLIVASGVSDPEETMAVARLSAILGWPIAADATSGLRVVGRSGAVGPLVLQHTDHVLLGGKAVWRALRPDVVLDVGCHLVSKRLAQFLEWCTVGGGGGEGESARWIRVFPHPARHDPSHAASHAVEMRCSALLAAVETASGGASVPVDQRRYAETLTQLDDVAAAAIARGIREVEEGPEQGGEPTEPGVAREVTSKLPQGWALFLGNSMPIRDVDMYCSGPRQRPGRLARASPGWDQPSAGAGGVPVMANRGASGIDGVLSTAIGAAEGLGRGVTLLVGDVSALHDSNGLSMLQEARGRPPVVVVLVNNGGGGIFSFLPVQDSIPASVFGAVFATPPGVDFGSLARAHGVLHRTVRRATDLPAALAEAWGSGEHCIVEVFTDRDSNTAVHRAIQARVAAAVAAAAPLLSGQAVCDVPESAVGIIGPLDVACRPYAVPLRRPVTTGARDDVRRGLLVEVSVSAASGGAPCRGLGEVAPLPGLHVESMERAREEAEMMAHLLRGKRAPLSAFLVLGGPLEWVARATGVAPDVLCPSVRAGIEAALLSAAADRLGVPLAKLLAAAAGDRAVTGDEDVPVCGLVSDSNPESAATRAAELADAGHVAVKLKVGRADAETDARVVTAVLGAVQGRRVSVRADANRAWAAPDAEAFLRAVGGALEFIEEPLRDAAGLRALSGSLGVDVALDETLDAAASGKTPGGGAYVSQREECARVDISEGGRVKSGAGESGRGDYGAAEAAGAAVREAGARTVVLKPSVLGGLHRSLEIAQVAKRSGCGRVVVSSAFESSVAVATCSSLAQALGSDGTAHGLGTLDWLATDAVPVRLAVEPTSAGAGFRGSSIDAVLRQSLGESDPGQAAVKVTRSTHAVHLGGGVFEAGVLRVMPPEGASPVRRPVVFLHGFLGCSDDFGPVIAALGTSRQVVSIDLPGHGASRWRGGDGGSGVGGPSVVDVAHAVGALIKLMGLEQPVVVGYSMGGRVAMTLASKAALGNAPALSGVVCLSASPGIADESARSQRAVADQQTAEWLRSSHLGTFLESWYNKPMWGALAAHPGFPAMVARRMGGDRDAMAQVMASMSVGHQDCVADTLALAGESFPVVLAAGSEDAKYAALTESLAGGAVAAGAGKAVRDALRGVARRGLVGVVVEGRGHAIPTECPDAVLGLVRWVAGDGE